MNDNQLRQDVLDELEWEASIQAAHIGVAAENGVVTLTGHVATFAQKHSAERAAGCVRGVRAIAQEIEVRPANANTTSDDEIAKRAVKILDWDVMVPKGVVEVKVQQGWVTLGGDVDWQYQRNAAGDDVRKLHGVKGVNNGITIKQKVEVPDLQNRIENALKRNAEIEAKGIKISVRGGRVTLAGQVHDWSERRVLENAVWSAPGVTAVEDQVSIA